MRASARDVGFARLRARLVAEVDARLLAATANGLTLQDLGDSDELPARVAEAISAGRHPTAALVGPCYDTPGLTRLLDVSENEILKRVRSHTLLACRTESGAWRYPKFQFDEQGNTLACLREVLDALIAPGDEGRWRAARWLAAPAPYLPDSASAAQWLRDGGDPTPVVCAARADGDRWR